MASLPTLDDDSDYEFSLEEETLLSQLVTDHTTTQPIVPIASAIIPNQVETPPRSQPDHAFHDAQAGHGFALKRPSGAWAKDPKSWSTGSLAEPPSALERVLRDDQVVSYPDLGKALSTFVAPEAPTQTGTRSVADPDTRSPLVRFRSFPKKPFSVSDLTAGSWCELQYFYTLTRLPYGRKTRTVAMKEGTKLHKELEDEVHTTVRVEVVSKEDAFGLKVWNLIQGLRTLRDTGLTRELEVWGFVDGNLVNGVIDGLSYDHPDPEFEAELRKSQESQPSITDYFASQKPGTQRIPQIYLTDVKTRGKRSTANAAQLRPAKVQLFLYHRFLSVMAAEKLDYLRIFRRYNLDPDEPFSDSFIAQIASLHDDEFFDIDHPSHDEYVPKASGSQKLADGSQTSTVSSAPDFIKYRTLRELLPLLVAELKQTFPHGADSVGRLLSVEYRYRTDGSLIDNRIFPMDDSALDAYIGGTMQWCKAKREHKGVQIEDAWKCLYCEFARCARGASRWTRGDCGSHGNGWR
ncbi:conserved hypothetical protein [Verticillium alfalfae VaMs.102]|uniref:Defects in morphology protein 1 n=1 Tax=Verticillium alfalfae (strain VaMs.102 / ATCC MYA-4576 / FGSC 10136) TaxID=526221 RepID=C9S671_VERA1|nr:conserved hypothetical protein [Verticillium alfalfae VaMs.102]EEY15133.1 conserved hypothetical protein [Verticillium alfalfae VaMs.102]